MDLSTRFRLATLIGVFFLAACTADVEGAVRRRALLVGINDYTASRIAPKAPMQTPAARDWPNLNGAVNDVAAMREMLVLLYGFDRRDIVTLTDQAATRAAILRALERQLAAPAAKGDVLLFYYAGHGSQVRNSASGEPDGLDESLVPADSRAGAPDIRDKELRPLFNRILDRGARLTVILDNCHSGSGARGLATGAQPRGVAADLRDVADATGEPRPEDRGALVLAAAQDFDRAWETRDEEGQMHGAFSWAWIRAMRDAAPDEPAAETFLRAQARLRAETPFQEPVLAGDAGARLRPFLGTRIDRRGGQGVVAVERVRADGTVVLQGGWANGLSAGSELREPRSNARVVITAMRGLGRAEGRASSGKVRAGALLEVVGWAAPPARPLRTFVPRYPGDAAAIASLARALAAAAEKRGLRWIADPTEVTPEHVLRWNGRWELRGVEVEPLAAIARLPRGASLFVQFPPPAGLLEPAGVLADADYVLAGRFAEGRVSYAWVRPAMSASDRHRSGLPVRTAWFDAAVGLRAALLRIRRIHAWQLLDSPPESRSPYRLALRRDRDRQLATEGAVFGEEKYSLVLRAPSPPPRVAPRYFYVFTVDSHGRSTLLFPRSGSVENRFPLQTSPPPEIPLGDTAAFEPAPPYGIDTYFLLSTDEPLPNPWILEWDSVRAAAPATATPLERLLLLTATHSRSTRLLTPATWSLERVVVESVPPG
ncbi:MAG TPA: caspase family protein [Thermoanaerobaculia bacterium]|jgi:hypothetical protein